MSSVIDKLGKSGIFLAGIFVFFALFSCEKDGETKAVVTVKDAAGNVVSGAAVVLWQDTSVNQTTQVQADVRQTKTTNSSGNAEFVFPLEAYLNISATKDTNSASGFIRLKEHETVSQTVYF